MRVKIYEASCRSCGWKGEVCGLSAIGIHRGVERRARIHNKQRNRTPTASPIAKFSIGWKPPPLAPIFARWRKFLAHSWNVLSGSWAKISGPQTRTFSCYLWICFRMSRLALSTVVEFCSTLGIKYAQLFLCWLLGRMPQSPLAREMPTGRSRTK